MGEKPPSVMREGKSPWIQRRRWCPVLFRSGRDFGAPDTIRTCGLRLRRATLYPAELRVLIAYAVLTRIPSQYEGRDVEPQPLELWTSFKPNRNITGLDTCLRRATVRRADDLLVTVCYGEHR